MPKAVILVGGSVIAIALGNTAFGPVIAVMLVAVLAYIALSSTVFQKG